MSGDWGPVVVAVVLFVLCSPGLLFQLPGNKRAVEFANFQTSPISIFVHTIIFFGLVTIFVIAIENFFKNSRLLEGYTDLGGLEAKESPKVVRQGSKVSSKMVKEVEDEKEPDKEM
ncbi:hypothetical protein Golax_002255, partial [Gossypium laxum]|nr:hypothetical protein [Gossypium laxum]